MASSYPNSGPSALIGQPPATQDDYWVVRGILNAIGLTDVDPKMGAPIPPKRPPPEIYHFETRGPGIVAGMSVSIGLMITFTGTRLMLRAMRKTLHFGPDDWMIIPALLVALIFPVFQIISVFKGGAGKHMYDITYKEFTTFHLLSSIQKIVFYMAVGMVKMSIVLFNMRLTGFTSKRWMYAHWVFFTAMSAYVLTSFFVVLLQCQPVQAGFDSVYVGKMTVPPKCMSENLLGGVLSGLHVASDFCLLAVPIIVLWRVQMSPSTKARIWIVATLGGMSCISSVCREIYQKRIGADPLYTFTNLLAWILVDLTSAVMVASLPVLSGLIPLLRLRKKSRNTSYPSNTTSFKKSIRPLNSNSSTNSGGDQIELTSPSACDDPSASTFPDEKSFLPPTIRHKVEYEVDAEYVKDFNDGVAGDDLHRSPKPGHQTQAFGSAV